MTAITILKGEYRGLLQRQARVEKELRVVKEILRNEISEEAIKPAVLKRWEKISRELDGGKGKVFSSAQEMRRWLGNL